MFLHHCTWLVERRYHEISLLITLNLTKGPPQSVAFCIVRVTTIIVMSESKGSRAGSHTDLRPKLNCQDGGVQVAVQPALYL